MIAMDLPRFTGLFNMSEDSRLLAEAEKGHADWRVYGWDGPWVSLGCYQDPNRDLLDPDSISWVMRPTGGKAVLHGHDVTVGLAFPLADLARMSGECEDRLARSIRSVYRLAIAPIVAALNECGLAAVLAEDRNSFGRKAKSEVRFEGSGTSTPLPPSSCRAGGGGRVADCFVATSPNDIVHKQLGMKVCGCALKLTQRAVLVQASIPAGPPLVDPRLVFAYPSNIVATPWDSERFAGAFEYALLAISSRV
jgi:lipoate-protein ligase A